MMKISKTRGEQGKTAAAQAKALWAAVRQEVPQAYRACRTLTEVRQHVARSLEDLMARPHGDRVANYKFSRLWYLDKALAASGA